MQGKEALKIAALAGGSAAAMQVISSGFLHRGESHGTIKLKPKLRMAARIGTWLLSGIRPRQWVGVHRKHHANEDKPRDPHSPVQNGRFGVPKVLVGNVFMYRKAVKHLTPEEYPADIPADKCDKWVFDKGWAGQIALGGLFILAHRGNLRRGLQTLAAADGLNLLVAGLVNGLAHAGREPLSRSLWNTPQPNEDGTYSRNLGRVLTAVTLGEGAHKTHHDGPGRLVLNDNPVLDPVGALGSFLIAKGWAERGTRPPASRVSESTASLRP